MSTKTESVLKFEFTLANGRPVMFATSDVVTLHPYLECPVDKFTARQLPVGTVGRFKMTNPIFTYEYKAIIESNWLDDPNGSWRKEGPVRFRIVTDVAASPL